ncbi:MAG: class I SAM-dependent methyltransferase [Rivularia sp. (in: cyanobacteria)]
MSLLDTNIQSLNLNIPRIRYECFREKWVSYHRDIVKQLAASPEVKTICEVGGGANPFLDLDFVQSNGLEYTIIDISADELAKAPDCYNKIQANIADPNLELPGKYDLVFSHFLAEHVENGLVFHRNVFNLLQENGRAFHVFPTLYAPPFAINHLLPEDLSSNILLFFFPHREKQGKYGKFPAYYSWCRGPIKSQFKKFESLGYSVEEYVGFYGHPYYKKVAPLHKIANYLAGFLKENPNPLLTTYAYVVLRKSSDN